MLLRLIKQSSSLQRLFFALIVVSVVGIISVYGSLETEAKSSRTYRVATYNILGSQFDIGYKIGGSVNKRATRATSIIKDTSFDVVGVQEMMPNQYRLFKKKLSGYAAFPTTPNHASQRTIYWKKSKLVQVDSGYLKYPFYKDKKLRAGTAAPWVKLKDKKTRQQFYVVNFHAVAWNEAPGSDKGGAQKRARTAEIARNWVKRKQTNKTPVMVIGDFNATNYLRIYPKNFSARLKDNYFSDKHRKLPYCILTRGQLTQNTQDMASGRSGTCPYREINSTTKKLVDYVFVTPHKVSVKKWQLIETAKARKASDHFPLYADITIRK